MLTKIDSTNIKSTGVVAGSYTNASITVNEQGQVTEAASGIGGGGNVNSQEINGTHEILTISTGTNSYREGSWVISTNIHANDTVNVGVTFSPDGIYMYTSGETSDAIDQYTLATPYDVSTAVYTRTRTIGTGFTYSTTQPRGITFDPTGIYVFIGDDLNNRVLRFDLSTAWDISTISTTNTMVSISTQTTGPGYGLQFSSDGLLMFINNQTTTSTGSIYTYSLTTPWTISSGVTYVRALAISTNFRSFIFSSDGLQLFALTSSGVVTRRTLTTAWDTSTASAVNQTITISSSNFPTATYGTPVYSIYLNESITGLSAGKRLYMSLPGTSSSEYIGQFELSESNSIQFLASPLFDLSSEVSPNITINPGTQPVYVARFGNPGTDMSKAVMFSAATVILHNTSYIRTTTSANYTVAANQIYQLTFINGSWYIADVDNISVKNSLINLPSQSAGLLAFNPSGTTLATRSIAAGSGISVSNGTGLGNLTISNTGIRELNQRSDTANVNLLWHPNKYSTYAGNNEGGTSPWINTGNIGTYHRSQPGGGWNATDTPENYVYDKSDETGDGSIYPNISFPRSKHNRANYFKRYYYYNTRWYQREMIFLGETNWRTNARQVRRLTERCWGGEGDWNMYYESEDTAGDGATYQRGIPYEGNSSQVPTGTDVSGTWLQSGTSTSPTVLSFSVTANSIIEAHVGGDRFTFTCWTADGSLERNVRGSINGPHRETYTFTGNTTFYYMYFAVGDNPDRTFARVLHSNIATAYWQFKQGADMGGTEWRYYIPSSERGDWYDGNYNNYFNNARLKRAWSVNTLALPLTTNSVARPFTIRARFRIDNATTLNQNIFWIANSAAPTNPNGIRVMYNEGSVDRRLSITLGTTANASTSGNIINQLKCWQEPNNGAEHSVVFVWNPLDTVFPGRLYVNDCLMFKTSSQPFSSSTSWFNIGATVTGTANGFEGAFNYLAVIPEAWGAHTPQGSITIDVDAGDTNWLTTTNNGSSDGRFIDAHSRHAIGVDTPQYLRGSSWGVGAILHAGNPSGSGGPLPGSSAEGSFTLTCSTTSGSSTLTLAKSTGGFPRHRGYFIVTGTGIPSLTRHVFVSVGFGDKQMEMFSYDGWTAATSTQASTTITFIRGTGGVISGGYHGGWTYLHMPSNATYVAKSSAVAATVTAELAGVHSGGTTSSCAFPDITFVVSAKSDTSNQYHTTNTAANDTAIRHLQNALGRGKKYTVTGSGISTTSATIDNAYIEGIEWDHQGRGLHLVYLNRDRNSTVGAGSTITAKFVPHWGCGFEGWEQLMSEGQGNVSRSIEMPGYSPSVWWSSSNQPDMTMTIASSVANWRAARVAPPGGVYDSGIFRATSTTYTKKMYLGYGCVGYLINYGTTGDFNQSTVNPVVSFIAWGSSNGMNSDGLSLTVVANTLYRIVILPLGTTLRGSFNL